MFKINKYKLTNGNTNINSLQLLNITQYYLLTGKTVYLNTFANNFIFEQGLTEKHSELYPLLVINTTNNTQSIVKHDGLVYELIFHEHHNINPNHKNLVFDPKWNNFYSIETIKIEISGQLCTKMLYNIDNRPEFVIGSSEDIFAMNHITHLVDLSRKYLLENFAKHFGLKIIDNLENCRENKILVFGINDTLPQNNTIYYIIWTKYDYNNIGLLGSLKQNTNINHLVCDKNLVAYFIQNEILTYTMVNIDMCKYLEIRGNFKDYGISQVYFSNKLSYLHHLAEFYKLGFYQYKNLPILMVGLFVDRDFEIIDTHTNHIYLLWHGNEFSGNNMEVFSKKYTHVKSFASSRYIYNKLLEYNIQSILINIDITDTSLFTPFSPTLEQKYIYIYNGVIQGNESLYGENVYKTLVRLLPEYSFIFSNSVGNLSRLNIQNMYKKCFVGLRLSNAGMGNQIKEMLAMGIPVIYNDDEHTSNNCVSWTNISDIVEHIHKFYKRTPKYLNDRKLEYCVMISDIDLGIISIKSIWLINTLNSMANNNNVVFYSKYNLKIVEGLSNKVQIIIPPSILTDSELYQSVNSFCKVHRIKKIYLYAKEFITQIARDWDYISLLHIYVTPIHLENILKLAGNYKTLITFSKTCYNIFMENGVRNIICYATPKNITDDTIKIVNISRNELLDKDDNSTYVKTLKRILSNRVHFIDINGTTDIKSIQNIKHKSYTETLNIIENSKYYLSDEIEYEFFGLVYYNVNNNVLKLNDYFNDVHTYVVYGDTSQKLRIVSYLYTNCKLEYDLIERNHDIPDDYIIHRMNSIHNTQYTKDKPLTTLIEYSNVLTFAHILENAISKKYMSIIILDADILIHRDILNYVDYNANISADIVYLSNNNGAILLNNSNGLYVELLGLLNSKHLSLDTCLNMMSEKSYTLYKYVTPLFIDMYSNNTINYIEDLVGLESIAFILPYNYIISTNLYKIPWPIFILQRNFVDEEEKLKSTLYYYLRNKYKRIVYINSLTKIVDFKDNSIYFYYKKYYTFNEYVEKFSMYYDNIVINHRLFMVEKIKGSEIYYINFANISNNNETSNLPINHDLVHLFSPQLLSDLHKFRGSKYVSNKTHHHIPMLSIILPTYNGINTIYKTIDSILEQTYTDYELIIVDDASYDNTDIYILDKYRQCNICLVKHSTPKGIYEAINTGIRHSRSKYITWINDTDHYTNADVIQNLITQLVNCLDIGFVYSGHNILNDSINNACDNVLGFLLEYRQILCVIVDKSFCMDGINTRLLDIEIYDLLCKILLKGCKFVSIPKSYYYSGINTRNRLVSDVLLIDTIKQFMLDGILDIKYFYDVTDDSKHLAYYHLASRILDINNVHITKFLCENIREYYRLSYKANGEYEPAFINYNFLENNSFDGLTNIYVDTLIVNNLICFNTNHIVKHSKTNVYISFIIYTSNDVNMVSKCIDSLNVDFTNMEIIIVNNGTSNDFRVLSNVKVISNSVKLDYFTAINMGCKHAVGKYVVCLVDYYIYLSHKDYSHSLVDLLVNNDDVYLAVPISNTYVRIPHIDINDFYEKSKKIVDVFKTQRITHFDGSCFSMNRENFIDIVKNGGEPKSVGDLLQKINNLGYNSYLCVDSIVYNTQQIHHNRFDFIFNSDNINISLADYTPIDSSWKYLEINCKNLGSLVGEFRKLLKNGETNRNKIDIDPFFYKTVNNINGSLDSIDGDDVYRHIHDIGVYSGYLYHPKQLLNIYGTDDVKTYNRDLFINYDGEKYVNIRTLLSHNLYAKQYSDHITNIIVSDTHITVRNMDLAIIVFIGYLEHGIVLLSKLLQYKKYCQPDFYLCVCFKNDELYNRLVENISTNFTNYAIYISAGEYGNDIIPTLQVFNHIVEKVKFNYVIKLHTKNDMTIFTNHVNYLLDNTLYNLTKIMGKNNFVCNPLYNTQYTTTDSCQNIINTYREYLDLAKGFPAGTMFMSRTSLFTNICNFIRDNNYAGFFNNNMYDSNVVNYNNSPIHFLERLFGFYKTNIDIETSYKQSWRLFTGYYSKLYSNVIIDFHNYRVDKCKKSINAVLVEFRNSPGVEFIIKNAIIKLYNSAYFTVVCGNQNYNQIQEINTSVGNILDIIRLDYDNLVHNEYNNLLCSYEFWDVLTGDKVLIYQDDSVIYKSNIDDFMEYDYIGAPWPDSQRDNRNNVGNGGFSLRTRKICLDIVANYPNDDRIFNRINFSRNTLEYKLHSGLSKIPEDVYFSTIMIELGYRVATSGVASSFSTELTYNNDSLGGHCQWLFYLRNNIPYTFEIDLTRIFRCVGVASPYDFTLGGGELYISQVCRYFIGLDYVVVFFSKSTTTTFYETLEQYLTPIEIDRVVLMNWDLLFDGQILDLLNFHYFFMMQNSVLPNQQGIGKIKNIYHCQFPTDYNNPPNNLSILDSYDIIIVNSEFTYKWYNFATKGNYSDKLHILYPPCGNTHPKPKLLNSDKKVFVMVGRIFKYDMWSNNKHFNVAIDIFNKLDMNYLLVIIGSVKSNEYYEQLRRSIRDPSKIMIIANADDGVKNYWLSQAHYYILLTGFMEGKPCNEEHFGISLIEAIKYGCVPICYNGGYPQYIIKDRVNGFLVNNVEEFSQLLVSLIMDSIAKFPIEKIDISKYDSNKFFDKIAKII